MPLQDISTQGPGMQTGLIPDLLRFAGMFAGKNKLRPDETASGDPSQPPKYKADWWDSLYGGQASRINAAGGIDQYNRQAMTNDLDTRHAKYLATDTKGILPRAIATAQIPTSTAQYTKAADEMAKEGAMGETEQAKRGGTLSDIATRVGGNLARAAVDKNATTQAELEGRAMANSADNIMRKYTNTYASTADTSGVQAALAQQAASGDALKNQLAAQDAAFRAQQAKADTGATVARYENTGVHDPKFQFLTTAMPTAQAMSEYDKAISGGEPKIMQPGSGALFPNGKFVSTSIMNGAPSTRQAFIAPSIMAQAEHEQNMRQGAPQAMPVQQEEPISPPPTAMPMSTPTGIGTPSQDKALQLINFLKSISTTSSKPMSNIRTGF